LHLHNYCIQKSGLVSSFGGCVHSTGPGFASDLLRLSRRCRGIDKYVAGSSHLSVDEMHCLSALFTERPASVTRLSELINVSASRASKLLKTLEERGLVSRTLDPDDHRREVVILTEPGTKVVEGILSLVADAGSELLGSWRAEGAADFTRLLQGATLGRKEGASA